MFLFLIFFIKLTNCNEKQTSPKKLYYLATFAITCTAIVILLTKSKSESSTTHKFQPKSLGAKNYSNRTKTEPWEPLNTQSKHSSLYKKAEITKILNCQDSEMTDKSKPMLEYYAKKINLLTQKMETLEYKLIHMKHNLKNFPDKHPYKKN